MVEASFHCQTTNQKLLVLRLFFHENRRFFKVVERTGTSGSLILVPSEKFKEPSLPKAVKYPPGAVYTSSTSLGHQLDRRLVGI